MGGILEPRDYTGSPTVFGQKMGGAATFQSRGCISSLRIRGPHLVRLRNNVLAVLEGDRVQTFGPSDGIRVGDITAIYGRGSELWVGGEFGLQQFDRGKISQHQRCG